MNYVSNVSLYLFSVSISPASMITPYLRPSVRWSRNSSLSCPLWKTSSTYSFLYVHSCIPSSLFSSLSNSRLQTEVFKIHSAYLWIYCSLFRIRGLRKRSCSMWSVRSTSPRTALLWTCSRTSSAVIWSMSSLTSRVFTGEKLGCSAL